MLTRITLAIVVALSIAIGTVFLWDRLKTSNENQVARIAEAESWAARAQLVRNSDSLLAALHGLRVYWAAQSQLPKDLWSAETGVDSAILDRVALAIWYDPANDVRWVRTPARPALDNRPTDDEWASYASLLDKAESIDTDTIVGPYVSENGDALYEVYLLNSDEEMRGTLIAIVNMRMALAAMLADESPGYAIRVYAEDQLLYSKGVPAESAPAGWTREGMIQPGLGNLWRVVHQPTEELQRSVSARAIDLILLLGFIIAALVGTLMFENGRAKMRASAAEKAEHEVSIMNRDLEKTVADRTRQLEMRTTDLQTLTDSVVHDLRNPLNSLSVNAQLLEEHCKDKLGENERKVLGRLLPSIQQMAAILDRLVGLSEATHSTFEQEPVDMQAMVSEVIEDLTVYEPTPPVTFDIGELPSAEADPRLLEMLWVNLIGNAIKYTANRDNRNIEIGCEEGSDPPTYFVRDDGIGFDQEQAAQMFEAFSRLGDASAAEGVGLGLTIASRVVERHGGRIWARGKPDSGATFYFTLGGEAADGNERGAAEAS